MQRRTTLKLIGLGATALALPRIADCSHAPALALAPWSGPPPDLTDPRLRALSYATLAPNAHNTQPWLISLEPDAIDLFVDGSRLLPETDPPLRQTHVSQGTFLELLVIALAEQGIAADVEYFPAGEYANDVLEPLPVARVHWAGAAATKDLLFNSICRRRSNKSVYDSGPALSKSEAQKLSAVRIDAPATLAIIDDAGARARLTGICTDAMTAEVRSTQRNIETARWFRFSQREVEEKRDGFGLAQSGRSGLTRWFAEQFILDRASAAHAGGAFAKGAIDQTRDQAASAAAFGVLSTEGNSRRAQVIAGRAYARIALTATSLGLAMHPLSQALEEYSDMAATKTRFENEVKLAPARTAQMFFRLGRAKPTEHTARRDVRALIKPA